MTHHTKPLDFDCPAHNCELLARANDLRSEPTRAERLLTVAAWLLILVSIVAVAGIALSSGITIARDAIAQPHVEGFP